MIGKNLFGPAIVVAAMSGAAFGQADRWIERPTATPGVDQNHVGNQANVTFGDAGEGLTNLNITAGAGPLTTIVGSMVSAQRPQALGGSLRSLDADMFCIRIDDPANFSAIATGTDTNLALFTLAGVAVAFNDNRVDSLTSTASRLTNLFTSSLPAGDYIIGISRNDGGAAARRFSRPLDPMGALIFPGMVNGGDETTDPNFPTRRLELGPITPGTAFGSWELFPTAAAAFNASYSIALTGTTFSTIPAPGASALLGFAGLALSRRRR